MIISSNTNEIANALNNNQVVCFKTDTIWGLSANPTNKEAVKNLYTFKQRNVDKPFIFLIKKSEWYYVFLYMQKCGIRNSISHIFLNLVDIHLD